MLLCPHFCQTRQMQIHGPRPDLTPAGQRRLRPAQPRQQRRTEQDGGPHLFRCLPRKGAAEGCAGNTHIAPLPAGLFPGAAHEGKAGLHIREPRHPPQPDGLCAQQTCRDQWQHAVFCRRDAHGSLQGSPSCHHDLFCPLCHIRSPHSAKDTTDYAKPPSRVTGRWFVGIWQKVCVVFAGRTSQSRIRSTALLIGEPRPMFLLARPTGRCPSPPTASSGWCRRRKRRAG